MNMDQTSRIDELNRRFGIAGIAQVAAGNGGLPKVEIAGPAASGAIYLHGAQVTSWRPTGAEEAIFLSGSSHWTGGKAIRGGIPICFPWFRAKADNPKAPAHGFVRTREWRLDSIAAGEDGVTVALTTESDDATRGWWPHEFRLVHRAAFGRFLRLELIATNTGASPFRFEEALHTYFRVGDARSASVRGLDGVRYLDNTDGNREKTQRGDLHLAAPTDNAYLNTHSAAEIVDPSLRRVLRTGKENSATTVAWNPWQQGAAALADLGDEEWTQMLCVEASNILDSAIELAPGEDHRMTATISVDPA
jgi:glucose-6-phosphate 1-epimerase